MWALESVFSTRSVCSDVLVLDMGAHSLGHVGISNHPRNRSSESQAVSPEFSRQFVFTGENLHSSEGTAAEARRLCELRDLLS